MFERGTKAISLSVELWLHYITFYTEEFGKLENGEEGIRGYVPEMLFHAKWPQNRFLHFCIFHILEHIC